MEWIGKLADLIRQPTVLFSCWLISGALVVLPTTWLQRLHLDQLLAKYGMFAGLAFIASSALLVVELVVWLRRRSRKAGAAARAAAQLVDAVSSLDERERDVLREFVVQGQDSIELPLGHPQVASLIRKGIIEVVGRFGHLSTSGPAVPVSITPPARPLITHEVLRIPIGQPSAADIEWVRNRRPAFAVELDRARAMRERWW